MAKLNALHAEALRCLSPQGSKRFWQGRRARGRKGAASAEPEGFGKRTFPLAPPPAPGYAKGGGGVAEVTHFHDHEDGSYLEAELTNEERAWLTAHDMPFPTEGRTTVLRQVQRWDAEIAQIAKRLLKHGPFELSSVGPAQQELSPKSIVSSTNTLRWREKARSRKRTR